MTTYKVVNGFTDAQDNNKVYKPGPDSFYPKGDYKPSKERIEELSTVHPKHKRIFIEAVEDAGAAADETDEEKEKEAIKAELDSLGVSFHPNTGLEKLKDKLAEAKAEKEKKE
ncbi:hypothetical protein ACQCVK_04230 [Rossellomorea vietnamensis]|uniref:hypothetical protein n=1 Tax=Rossellomorea vietnamensis TaxID=218284 RepID=UPI003CF13B6A